MSIKLAADVLAKVAAADQTDRRAAWSIAFLKTATELGLDEQEAVEMHDKYIKAAQAAQ